MKYTINDMIAYLEKSIATLKDDVQPLEQWVTDAIEIETSIIEVLRSQLPAVQSLTEDTLFNEDQIGVAITKRLPVLERVMYLRSMVNNSAHPENIAGYRAELAEKENELKWHNTMLLELKLQHKRILQNKLRAHDAGLESYLPEPVKTELRELRNLTVKKIAQIEEEIKTYA